MRKSKKQKLQKRNFIVLTILAGLLFMIILGLFLASRNIIALKQDPKNFTIMIDPGHGGAMSKDGGATGTDGTKEYILNEEVSKKLYKSLKAKGYNVIYSRDPDKHIKEMTLTKKTKIANEKKPDLFISIHHDASSDKNFNGYTVYYSSYKYGMDNEDAVVYNNGLEYEFIDEKIKNGDTIIYYKDQNGNTKKSSSGEGTFTVVDPTPSAEAEKGKEAAEIIDKNLSSVDYLSPFLSELSSVKDNDYRVLRRVSSPSVLVECGFVSNSEELEKIKKPSNQKKLVNKLTESINEYFNVW